MKESIKVDRILDAWLQFIRIENHSNAKIPAKDARVNGITLKKDSIFIDKAMFGKYKKSYQLNEKTSRNSASTDASLVLSFPQIYTPNNGSSEFYPLFSLDISPILNGDY